MKPFFIQQAIIFPLKALGIVFLLYLAIAGVAWQIRNPKANQVTFWSHLPQALKLERVESFQE